MLEAGGWRANTQTPTRSEFAARVGMNVLIEVPKA